MNKFYLMKSHGIPNKITKELSASRAILEYLDDWDGMGAVHVPKVLYDTMERLVKEYGSRFADDYITQLSIEINAVPDGSIDVAWYMPQARILMNFRNAEGKDVQLYYYGARKEERDAIKGSVDTDHAKEFLVTWMNTVLC